MGTPYQKMTDEQKKKSNARKERWRLKNRDKVLQYKRKHYANNKAKYLTLERDRQYRKRYGITLADYDSMLLSQRGQCAICCSTTAGTKGQCFAVDHDHATGFVRGLLCIKCNARLGWFEANAENVAQYLERVRSEKGKANY